MKHSFTIRQTLGGLVAVATLFFAAQSLSAGEGEKGNCNCPGDKCQCTAEGGACHCPNNAASDKEAGACTTENGCAHADGKACPKEGCCDTAAACGDKCAPGEGKKSCCGASGCGDKHADK